MEKDLRTWDEKLKSLSKGAQMPIGNTHIQTIYSAARKMPSKIFSIRRDKSTKTETYLGDKFVIRIK